MRKVYQKITDFPDLGDCMKACVCSALELNYDDVPNFVEYANWFTKFKQTLVDHGYRYAGMYYNFKDYYINNPTVGCFEELKFLQNLSIENLRDSESINGLFFGIVYSPKYFRYDKFATHMVLIDKSCNIVFDPNPNYKNLIEYPFSKLIGFNGVIQVIAVNKLTRNGN